MNVDYVHMFVPSAQVLLLILKWGGELTAVGQRQAEELGRAFRCMYPGGEGEYASLPGSGFLRLHSTYRHDLKVYASDEGRVQMTAAAFTKVVGADTDLYVYLYSRRSLSLSTCRTELVCFLHNQ